MYHFCTYLDHRYLARGLALYESLRRHRPGCVLYVLCLDDMAYHVLRGMSQADLVAVPLAKLESIDNNLARTRSTRSLVEYYFTCTPAWLRFVMNRYQPDLLSYVYADLYFFSDPEEMFGALAHGSILIIAHRYPPALDHFLRYGKYNVGLLSFRNDRPGRACLDWWHQQCMQWCYERVEPTRYADHKYLDQWPDRFDGVVELPHPGANLAPWNLASHRLRARRGAVLVDDGPLIFYHFHRLKLIRPYLFDLGLSQYDAPASSVVRRHIYRPYLRHLRRLLRLPELAGTGGNLRMTTPTGGRELIRTLLYSHTLLNVGPFSSQMHLEPLARPLLRLRELTKRAA